MLVLSLLVLACVAWLVWEWKSAALAANNGAVRNRPERAARPSRSVATALPTAAALGIDADVAVRFDG